MLPIVRPAVETQPQAGPRKVLIESNQKPETIKNDDNDKTEFSTVIESSKTSSKSTNSNASSVYPNYTPQKQAENQEKNASII